MSLLKFSFIRTAFVVLSSASSGFPFRLLKTDSSSLAVQWLISSHRSLGLVGHQLFFSQRLNGHWINFKQWLLWLRGSLNANLTWSWSGTGRWCHWRGVGASQAQQGRHAAASLGPSTRHVAVVSRSLPFALRAGHELISLIDHHALREGWRERRSV